IQQRALAGAAVTAMTHTTHENASRPYRCVMPASIAQITGADRCPVVRAVSGILRGPHADGRRSRVRDVFEKVDPKDTVRGHARAVDRNSNAVLKLQVLAAGWAGRGSRRGGTFQTFGSLYVDVMPTALYRDRL